MVEVTEGVSGLQGVAVVTEGVAIVVEGVAVVTEGVAVVAEGVAVVVAGAGVEEEQPASNPLTSSWTLSETEPKESMQSLGLSLMMSWMSEWQSGVAHILAFWSAVG